MHNAMTAMATTENVGVLARPLIAYFTSRLKLLVSSEVRHCRLMDLDQFTGNLLRWNLDAPTRNTDFNR
jgi:hypothetical protein